MKRWSREKYDKVANKVLLFVRLENAVRPGTIMKIAKRRDITLPASCCPYRFADYMRVKEVTEYSRFRENWPLALKVITGDREALETIAQQFVENCYDDGVAYVETRFSPHLLAGPNLSPAEVTSILLTKLRKTGEELGVYCNSLLCCLRERPDQATEVLDLVRKFQDEGAVGIALSGDEMHFFLEARTSPQIVDTFREAAYFHIHRTVEAGGITPPKAVWEALKLMSTERIGYGYRVAEDPKLYDWVYTGGYHIETSIMSSHLTSAVCSLWNKHPVLQFLNDGINFSINNDMPLLTGTNLSDEYAMCRHKLHMTCPQFYSSNKKAAKAAFINYYDREDLLRHLKTANDTLLSEEVKLKCKFRNLEQYVCPICLEMVDDLQKPPQSTKAVFVTPTYPPNYKFDCLHFFGSTYGEKYR